ncbi:MAG: MBOAT family O-acyltransferase, partial [Henriciella sp.]|uniref:MBOAT family O-acyltransferase n=1 Tax=Henriciella sp. TaxID=1968823 RepID=UPI003C7748D9
MLFSTFLFALFFLGVFTLYWSLPSGRARVIFLLAASYVFYGAWDYRFLGLISFVILVAYIGQHALFRRSNTKARNWITGISVTLLLATLGVFKYFNFFADSFVILLQRAGIEASQPTLSIILPVGVSFYIFQAIGFIVDVRRGEFKDPRGFIDTAFFVAFFPQLVAGPIVRAADFFPQIDLKKQLSQIPWSGVMVLFMGGFFKKVVVADNLGLLCVDPVFADPSGYSQSAIIYASLAYTVQIFCDFSGYSDMAIAVSRCFGYQIPINFRGPLFSSTITDFWRRWHISLSAWLRDYLYIPLGGSRNGEGKTLRNLMATMV